MKNKTQKSKTRVVDTMTDAEKKALEKELRDQKTFDVIAVKGMC